MNFSFETIFNKTKFHYTWQIYIYLHGDISKKVIYVFQFFRMQKMQLICDYTVHNFTIYYTTM